jgi:N6-L-threonylcarbamoyladenine synthase
MKILGIETSCDETAVAIVTDEGKILSNIVFSQLKEHEEYGGVVPEIAARSHLAHLPGVLEKALAEAGCSFQEIDAFAATAGPGLIGGVIVGVMMAKSLASVHGKPFIAVNHLEGHALTVRLTDGVEFPYLLLLVSGGHCQLLSVKGLGNYEKLGGTLDDALGEAFDKVAKMLGLGFPGGPAVEKAALTGNPLRFPFPEPLKNRAGCDFSFSGLKTSVRTLLANLVTQPEGVTEQDKADICASFQYTVGKTLQHRVAEAMKCYAPSDVSGRQLVVAGGVAANRYLRAILGELCEKEGYRLILPPLSLCTDNAAMIAWAGLERFRAGETSSLATESRPRWPLDELLPPAMKI